MNEQQHGHEQDAQEDEGVFKKPLKGSFKRVGEQITEEMQGKTPTEALRDDLGGSTEPTDEERENLE
ncbi:MAG TPA: hypothetical protein VM324_12380 [Egibacteraceae bacterium]|jgi:hypothetical protein|nr:hypothetical protein [Egibacteraceae bacterium]